MNNLTEFNNILNILISGFTSSASNASNDSITLSMSDSLINAYTMYSRMDKTFTQNQNGNVIEMLFLFYYITLYEMGIYKNNTVAISRMLNDLHHGNFCNDLNFIYCDSINNKRNKFVGIKYDPYYMNWTHTILYMINILSNNKFPFVSNGNLYKVNSILSVEFTNKVVFLLNSILFFRLFNIRYIKSVQSVQINIKDEVSMEYCLFATIVSFYYHYNIVKLNKQDNMYPYWSFMNAFLNANFLSKGDNFLLLNIYLSGQETKEVMDDSYYQQLLGYIFRRVDRVKSSISDLVFKLKVEYYLDKSTINNTYGCITESFLEKYNSNIKVANSIVNVELVCLKNMRISIWKDHVYQYVQKSKIIIPSVLLSITPVTLSVLTNVDANYLVSFMYLFFQSIYLLYFTLTRNNITFGVHTIHLNNDLKVLQEMYVSSGFPMTSIKNVSKRISSITTLEPTLDVPLLLWIQKKNEMSDSMNGIIYSYIPLPNTTITFTDLGKKQQGGYGSGSGNIFESTIVQKMFEYSLYTGVIDKDLPESFKTVLVEYIKHEEEKKKIIQDFKNKYILREIPLHVQLYIKQHFQIKSKIGGGSNDGVQVQIPEFDSTLYNIVVIDKGCTASFIEETIHNDQSKSYNILAPLTSTELEAINKTKNENTNVKLTSSDLRVNVNLLDELKDLQSSRTFKNCKS